MHAGPYNAEVKGVLFFNEGELNGCRVPSIIIIEPL